MEGVKVKIQGHLTPMPGIGTREGVVSGNKREKRNFFGVDGWLDD